MAYEVNGTTVEADEEGYIIDISVWNPELAVLIAEGENIEMGDDAWEVGLNRPAKLLVCQNRQAVSRKGRGLWY